MLQILAISEKSPEKSALGRLSRSGLTSLPRPNALDFTAAAGLSGATENARHENTGRSKMQGWKMRDMKMRDQFARVENAGKVSMESQSVKKCLKVVVFVCRIIPSV